MSGICVIKLYIIGKLLAVISFFHNLLNFMFDQLSCVARNFQSLFETKDGDAHFRLGSQIYFKKPSS